MGTYTDDELITHYADTEAEANQTLRRNRLVGDKPKKLKSFNVVNDGITVIASGALKSSGTNAMLVNTGGAEGYLTGGAAGSDHYMNLRTEDVDFTEPIELRVRFKHTQAVADEDIVFKIHYQAKGVNALHNLIEQTVDGAPTPAVYSSTYATLTFDNHTVSSTANADEITKAKEIAGDVLGNAPTLDIKLELDSLGDSSAGEILIKDVLMKYTAKV